eukprot:SM000277S10338  [mRNA]  locus=s277:70186:70660:+ [translate_table: standard]
MPRTKLVFEWIFALEGSSWAPGNGHAGAAFELTFVPVSDACIDPKMVQARTVKEAESVLKLQDKISSIRTLAHFHEWFHTEHKAYNVADQADFGKQADPSATLLCY